MKKNCEPLFKSKTLLITGGTGSFGHAVLKHFLYSDIGQTRMHKDNVGKASIDKTASPLCCLSMNEERNKRSPHADN